MYSKQESARIKQDFWTRFGQYMKPVQSATGEKVNWPNYKTGIPHLYVRLRAERSYASVAIEVTDPDERMRQERFAQLRSLQALLHEAFSEEMVWEGSTLDESGKPIARVSVTLPGVSIFRESDWPAIISFFKSALIGWDSCWADAKTLFE